MKRIISFAALLMLVFAGKVFAGELCDKVGIKSTDTRVVIGTDEDCVYVMQHPSSTVSSIVISPARLKAAVSSDDYTLSYVTEEKKAAPLSAKVFYDGYVKAVSKADKENIVYIPIKMYKGEEYSPTVDAPAGAAGGREGSALLTPDGDAAELNIIDTLPDADRAFTCEFGFYAEDGAELKVSAADKTLFRYKNNGDVAIDADTGISAGYANWHRAALDYCPQTQKFALYVDGKRAAESAAVASANKLTFTAENSGCAAIDDLKLYGGYYYADKYFGYASLAANGDGIIVDADKGVIYADLTGAADLDEFMSRFSTDASAYFTDGALAHGSRLVLMSANGAFSYYRIALAVGCEVVEFERADGNLKVNSHISNALGTQTNLVMVVVLRDSDGIMRDVAFSEECGVGKDGADIVIDGISCENLTAEVFFINNLSDRAPMLEDIYAEEGESGV